MNAATTRQPWEALRVDHHIAARKALGAYIEATTEVRAADLRRSQEFARKVRRLLSEIRAAPAA